MSEHDSNQEFMSDEERESLRVEHMKFEAEVRARESRDFWQAVFDSEVGRREMFSLLTEMHTFDTPFAVGPNGFPQPEATWFRFGTQSYGLSLYHRWIRNHREAVMQMHEEASR